VAPHEGPLPVKGREDPPPAFPPNGAEDINVLPGGAADGLSFQRLGDGF